MSRTCSCRGSPSGKRRSARIQSRRAAQIDQSVGQIRTTPRVSSCERLGASGTSCAGRGAAGPRPRCADRVRWLDHRGRWPPTSTSVSADRMPHRASCSPGPFARHTDRVMASVLRVHSYDEVVQRVADGPPLRCGRSTRSINLSEFFVHTEDVRRANGRGPRELPAEQAAVDVAPASPDAACRCSAGPKTIQVEFTTPTGEHATARQRPRTVRLAGGVGELVLYCLQPQGHRRGDHHRRRRSVRDPLRRPTSVRSVRRMRTSYDAAVAQVDRQRVVVTHRRRQRAGSVAGAALAREGDAVNGSLKCRLGRQPDHLPDQRPCRGR